MELTKKQLIGGVAGIAAGLVVGSLIWMIFGIVPSWPDNIVGVLILLALTLTNGCSESPDFAAYQEHMKAIPPEEL